MFEIAIFIHSAKERAALAKQAVGHNDRGRRLPTIGMNAVRTSAADPQIDISSRDAEFRQATQDQTAKKAPGSGPEWLSGRGDHHRGGPSRGLGATAYGLAIMVPRVPRVPKS